MTFSSFFSSRRRNTSSLVITSPATRFLGFALLVYFVLLLLRVILHINSWFEMRCWWLWFLDRYLRCESRKSFLLTTIALCFGFVIFPSLLCKRINWIFFINHFWIERIYMPLTKSLHNISGLSSNQISATNFLNIF